LDYLQTTLNFSNYMRNEIRKLGVGQAAVNIAFQTSVKFSDTFILEKVIGEEPIIEYFVDLGEFGDNMAKSVSFEKEELKKQLRGYALNEMSIEEICNEFAKNNKHLDIVAFVLLLEKYGIARKNITNLLKNLGVEDSVIVDVFGRVDFKKLGVKGARMTKVTLDEEFDGS